MLKNPENLNDQRDERQRLQATLALNQPLATVYYMKEDLRQLWNQKDKPAAEVFLNDWIARARASGIRMLQQFAATLGFHRSGLLAYYDCPITTAALGGHQQQNQNHATPSLRLPRPRVLQVKNLCPSRNDLRISRMNPI